VIQFSAMKLYGWDHVPEEQLNPNICRRVIHGEKMTIAQIRLRKGAMVAEHRHDHEQTSMIQQGRLRFVVAGEEAMLQAGDILMIPPGAPHSVEVLEDCVVVDMFSPARDDWQRGDDAYLRR
jgi:quercetin dioxygenase-like cupin family protein